ncbi:MAG: response regulator [Myxococcota bacterium]
MTFAAPNPSLHIAVIEDEDDVRVGLQNLLEHWGHRVEVAGNGLLGVELIVRSRPDVALLDIGLPGIDGYAVARRIRDTLGEQSPRLIALSGFAQDEDRVRSLQAGFDVHLVKPPNLDELRNALAPPPGREVDSPSSPKICAPLPAVK